MDDSNENLRGIIPEWFCLLPKKLEYTKHLCCEGHGNRTKDLEDKENFSYLAKYYCLSCKEGCLCITCFKVGNVHYNHEKIHIYRTSERPSIKALTLERHPFELRLTSFYRALHELSTYSWNNHMYYFLAPPKTCKKAKTNMCHTCKRKETSSVKFKYCSIKCLIDSSLPIRPMQSIDLFESTRESKLKKISKKRVREDVFDSQIRQDESSHVLDAFQQLERLKMKKFDHNMIHSSLSPQKGKSHKMSQQNLRTTKNVEDEDKIDKYLQTMHSLVSKMGECIEASESNQQEEFALEANDKNKKDLNEQEIFNTLTKALQRCKKSQSLKQLTLPSKSVLLVLKQIPLLLIIKIKIKW